MFSSGLVGHKSASTKRNLFIMITCLPNAIENRGRTFSITYEGYGVTDPPGGVGGDILRPTWARPASEASQGARSVGSTRLSTKHHAAFIYTSSHGHEDKRMRTKPLTSTRCGGSPRQQKGRSRQESHSGRHKQPLPLVQRGTH